MENWTPTQALEVILTVSTGAAAVIYFLVAKILPPVIQYFTDTKPDGKDSNVWKEIKNLKAATLKLENNHLAHLKEDIGNLTNSFNGYTVRRDKEDMEFREQVLQRITAVETALRLK